MMPFAPRKADAREHPNAGDKWGRHELRGKQGTYPFVAQTAVRGCDCGILIFANFIPAWPFEVCRLF